MAYLTYIILGITPSLIWLFFFLKEDVHPESKKMILKIFLFGMLAAVLVGLLEDVIVRAFENLVTPLLFSALFLAPLIEETAKYLVVREKVIYNSEFDEAVDAMLYMIIAALGFAAVENILHFFNQDLFLYRELYILAGLRFVGATFLHALTSASLGYFMALSFFKISKRRGLIITGITLAITLHALYNFLIIKLSNNLQLIIPALLLIFLALFVLLAFRKLKTIKNVCLFLRK